MRLRDVLSAHCAGLLVGVAVAPGTEAAALWVVTSIIANLRRLRRTFGQWANDVGRIDVSSRLPEEDEVFRNVPGVYRSFAVGLALVLFFGFPGTAGAYSVLSHEEVVDMAWLTEIVPLLKLRFPNLTDDDLRTAHAYAYGGSVIQDIGYYPFASQENPRLRKRFGPVVTYEENPVAHVRTEFGFDVVEVAHGRYSQQNYRDFIGFQVAKPLIERAFVETYGVPMVSIMKNEDLAIGSYRWAVSRLIPQMTKVALVSYHDEIEKEDPGFDHKKFVYRLKRTEFEKTYGKQYIHPGIGSRILALFIRILPKVGPLRALQIKVANAGQQDLYIKSVNRTVDALNQYIQTMRQAVPGGSAGNGQKLPDLPEIDLDTGKPSQLGEYRLADQSYALLLDSLLHDPTTTMTPDLHQSFLDFYGNRVEPAWYLKKPAQWEKVRADLKALETAPVSATSAASNPPNPAPTAVN
jgi:hypothetical protein